MTPQFSERGEELADVRHQRSERCHPFVSLALPAGVRKRRSHRRFRGETRAFRVGGKGLEPLNPARHARAVRTRASHRGASPQFRACGSSTIVQGDPLRVGQFVGQGPGDRNERYESLGVCLFLALRHHILAGRGRSDAVMDFIELVAHGILLCRVVPVHPND